MTFRRLVLASVFFASPLIADSVLMRDGRRLDGAVIAQNRYSIVIVVNGVRQTINKADITRIVFEDGRREDQLRKQEEDAARQDALRKEEERRAQEARRAEEARRLEEARNEVRRLEEQSKKEKAAEEKRQADARAQQDALDQARARANTSGALLRSAVLPGWGQYYQGRGGDAAIYGVGFVGSLGLLSSAYQSAKTAQTDYRAAALALKYSTFTAGPVGQLMVLSTLQDRNHARAVQLQRSRLLIGASLLVLGAYGANLYNVYTLPVGARTALVLRGDLRATEAALVVRY
ncbi:MAG: hypothetical protein HY042_11525 [Spirochaetia bacterium]|nr:hypothetical protein [Spirochaetia bacterium]